MIDKGGFRRGVPQGGSMHDIKRDELMLTGCCMGGKGHRGHRRGRTQHARETRAREDTTGGRSVCRQGLGGRGASGKASSMPRTAPRPGTSMSMVPSSRPLLLPLPSSPFPPPSSLLLLSLPRTLSAPTGGSGSPNLGMMGKDMALGSTIPMPGTSGLFSSGRVTGSSTICGGGGLHS